MGWESRHGRRYLYQKQRVGGRVVSRYVGAGVIGQFVELQARDERQKQQRQQAKERAAREECEALSCTVASFYQQVDAVLLECLEAAGYHRHNRGGWRKRRKGVDGGEG